MICLIAIHPEQQNHRVSSGGTADACNCRELFAVLPRSCISEIPHLPDSLIIGPQILLFHYLDIVLLVSFLPLFVEVDQFLVQQPIEQFEIFHEIAVLPATILSSADVVQHVLDFSVAKHLPRVVLEDSILCGNSKLLISSPYFYTWHCV